jgi:hypothetical protein
MQNRSEDQGIKGKKEQSLTPTQDLSEVLGEIGVHRYYRADQLRGTLAKSEAHAW